MKDLIFALATWRISSILVHEAAPYELASRLRRAVGVKHDARGNVYSDSEFGKLFLCVWCMSIWVGWLLAFVCGKRKRALITGLAYSTVAIVIESVVRR
jgi:hypothetical protein